MKNKLLFILSACIVLGLTGCASSKGRDCNERQAMAILNQAIKNFMDLESYIQAKYEVNWVTDTDVETKVYYNAYSLDEDNNIVGLKAETDNDLFTLGYPLIVKNNSEVKDNQPTLIMETYKDKELNKYIHNETLFFQDEFQQYKNYEVTFTPINIPKKDMLDLLTSANDGKLSDEVSFGAYTGGYFYTKVFPKSLTNLVKSEDVVENGKTYTVLKGELNTFDDDHFAIFKKASVEFWIDKEKKLIVREVYTSLEDTEYLDGENTIIFEYSKFNSVDIPEDFYKKDISEKISYFKDSFK